VPVHHADQEFWFRLIEVRLTALVAHEFGSLVARPSTLCFVKNHDTLDGRFGIAQRFVAEVVDILNEARNPAFCIRLGGAIPVGLVARQRLAQNLH
jgi:hypothetical protein